MMLPGGRLEKRRGEIVLRRLIISQMLTRVSLRQELRVVYEELFSSNGSEIFFYRIVDCGVVETPSRITRYAYTAGHYTFTDLPRVAKARREIATGIRRAGQERTINGSVELNPSNDQELNLEGIDELIISATYE